MKPLLLLAALTLSLASAQAVDTKGVPAAEIGGFFHLGVRSLDESKFGQTLDKAFGDDVRANPTFRAFKEKLGFDFEKDLNDVVVGFYPGVDPKSPQIAGVIRGRFDVAKIEAYAKSAKVDATALGSFTGWDVDQLGSSLEGKERTATAGATKADRTLIVFVSADTALVGSQAKLGAALDAYAGKAASFRPTTDLSAPGAPFLRIEADVEALKMPGDPNGLRRGVLTLGETGPNLVATFDGQMINVGKATQVASQLKGMAGLISIGLMDEANKTPDQIASQQVMLELIQSLKSEAKGDHVLFMVSYDAEKAALGMVKAVVAQKAKATPGK
jgi:hypothetical protein